MRMTEVPRHRRDAETQRKPQRRFTEALLLPTVEQPRQTPGWGAETAETLAGYGRAPLCAAGSLKKHKRPVASYVSVSASSAHQPRGFFKWSKAMQKPYQSSSSSAFTRRLRGSP